MKKKSEPIHSSLKEGLGYDVTISDREILKDWRSRTRHVCKPCWELKYCPYGPMVQQSPALRPDRAEAVKAHEYYQRCLTTNRLGQVSKITEDTKKEYQRILVDQEALIRRAIYTIEQEDRLEASLRAKEPVKAFMGSFVGDMKSYLEGLLFLAKRKVDFHPIDYRPPKLDDLDPDTKRRIEAAISEDRTTLEKAITTGLHDATKPLDPVRKMMFEQRVSEFKPEEYPDEIPKSIRESECNIFGRICPVFFSAEAFTETSEGRRRGRYIPFDVKMRVVRRDNYTCQECGVHLRDDEVEFDHIIPVAKGGSSEEHNIRLTCFDCNRDKRDQVKI